ncbi:MAG: hypothetical protein N3B14_02195 [Thermoleophilia bacterium]|nr:hypothetical protein [Thermoleophilia bacterium]
MRVLESTTALQQEILRVTYELAGGEARKPVFFGDLRSDLDATAEEVERACEFWAERGILDWVTLGHVALTHMGVRRAERLAARGWSLAPF